LNFGADHYVPVLKVKRGEKKALRAMAPSLRSRITPLLEIVQRKPEKGVAAHLDTAFDGLAAAARAYRRCFLDAREIEPDGRSAAAAVFRRATAAGLVFTPVTGMSRTADVAAALANAPNGIAIRLTRQEFEAGQIRTGLPAFLGSHGLRPAKVDLIVDLGAVDQLVTEGVATLAESFLADVPDHSRWRTLTISACAFPSSMGGVQGNSHNFVERCEWQAWRDELYANRRVLARLPTFSDCAIQHPEGVEGFDPRIMQVSAAIRYALPEKWLLIKGESTRTVPPSQQFPHLATQLIYGHLLGYFAGQSHCEGCRSMKAAADGAPQLGSAETWRRLGTIHHVTRAIEEVMSLPGP
jgi:hypothetical protein